MIFLNNVLRTGAEGGIKYLKGTGIIEGSKLWLLTCDFRRPLHNYVHRASFFSWA